MAPRLRQDPAPAQGAGEPADGLEPLGQAQLGLDPLPGEIRDESVQVIAGNIRQVQQTWRTGTLEIPAFPEPPATPAAG